MSGCINAYEFSFFNTTKAPIAIAIQFANSEDEPLYKLYIKPGTMKSFVPGTIDIPDIKWSFCLKNIFYIKNPTMQERAHNFAQVKNWKKTSITWSEMTLQTTPERKHSPQQQRKQNINVQKQRLETKKKTTPAYSKSLCKDRHFEITEDENDNIVITSSLVE